MKPIKYLKAIPEEQEKDFQNRHYISTVSKVPKMPIGNKTYNPNCVRGIMTGLWSELSTKKDLDLSIDWVAFRESLELLNQPVKKIQKKLKIGKCIYRIVRAKYSKYKRNKLKKRLCNPCLTTISFYTWAT